MTIDINGTQEDISAMLIGAERYALGRRTYIVQWTCEFIGNNLHLLTDKDKAVMIRDIEQADYYGDECDKQCWLRLLNKLKGIKNYIADDEYISKEKVIEKIKEIKDEYDNRIKDNDSYYVYSNEYAHIEEVLRELLEE